MSIRIAASRRTWARPTAVLALILASLLGAAPAESYTITQRSGVPVPPVVYRVQGTHVNTGTEITGPMWRERLYQTGPVAYRTASGDQTVHVTYRVFRWDGTTWRTKGTQSGFAQIPAGLVSARLPALNYRTGGPGYYSVQVSLTWTSAIGAVQGSMRLSMNHQGDYTCNTTRPCRTGPGWVYLG